MRPELEGKKPWSEPVIMEALSQRYGWTPKEIRAMDVQDIIQYLEIMAETHTLERAHALKHKK